MEYTLPAVICNWLETTTMQEEFKSLIFPEEVKINQNNSNKSNLLIRCLTLKGDFRLYLSYMGLYGI